MMNSVFNVGNYVFFVQEKNNMTESRKAKVRPKKRSMTLEKKNTSKSQTHVHLRCIKPP